jgi:osmotically-inducible protein OsmY
VHPQQTATRSPAASKEDLQTAEAVRQRLQQHPYVRPSSLRVTVERGVVRLSGSVQSDLERKMAEQVSVQVRGVKQVVNEIGVVSTEQSSDGLVERSLRAEMAKTPAARELKLSVNKGVVTVNGTVKDWDAYDAVMEAIYRAGPTSVVNELSVAPSHRVEYMTVPGGGAPPREATSQEAAAGAVTPDKPAQATGERKTESQPKASPAEGAADSQPAPGNTPATAPPSK